MLAEMRSGVQVPDVPDVPFGREEMQAEAQMLMQKQAQAQRQTQRSSVAVAGPGCGDDAHEAVRTGR